MWDDEILAEQFVVIADDLLKRVPFENRAVGVIDIGSNSAVTCICGARSLNKR